MSWLLGGDRLLVLVPGAGAVQLAVHVVETGYAGAGAWCRVPAGAGAVSWLRTWWSGRLLVPVPVLVMGAGCRCWCCELAVHVVETGCWCWRRCAMAVHVCGGSIFAGLVPKLGCLLPKNELPGARWSRQVWWRQRCF